MSDLEHCDRFVEELQRLCATHNAVLFPRQDSKGSLLSLVINGIWIDFARIDSAGVHKREDEMPL